MNEKPTADTTTEIYKLTQFGEDRIGYVGADGTIYKLRWDEGHPIGHVEERGQYTHIFRNTLHDERELGTVDAHGTVYSHGLFEGGNLGWVESDGVVMQGGMILGEEEVGRVQGPQPAAAAAALLLLFLPDDAEANHRSAQHA